MDDKRKDEIDILRGIAVILVVIGHAFIVYPIDISHIPWCKISRYFIYSFHMGLFFILAGYIYVCFDYKQYIKKKFKRILIPYIFFSFINLISHVIGNQFVNEKVSIRDGIYKIITGQAEWFLPTIFIIYIFYPIVTKIFMSLWSRLLIAIFCIIILNITTDIPGVIYNVLFYLPFFIVGNIIQEWKGVKKINLFQAIIIFISSLCIASLGIFFDFNHILIPLINKYMRGFGIISCLIIVILKVFKTFKNKENIILNLLRIFSKYSLQIYLLNGYPLTILRFLICIKFHVYNAVVIVILLVIGIISSTLLVSLSCEKIKFLAFLMGLKYKRMRDEKI